MARSLSINFFSNIRLTGRNSVCKVWFGVESKERAGCEEINSENTDGGLTMSLQVGNDSWHFSKKRKFDIHTNGQPQEHEDDSTPFPGPATPPPFSQRGARKRPRQPRECGFNELLGGFQYP